MKAAPYEVCREKQIRVIIDTDAYAECDDQFAIVHQLMTPKFDVKGIIGCYLGSGRDTVDQCVREAETLLELMGLSGNIPVWHGAEGPLVDERTPRDSDGVQAIIAEAEKDDDRPLFIACQAPITNVASAILQRPDLAQKLTVVWTGGGAYPRGGYEPNAFSDLAAANVVMDSKAEVWQIPVNVYSQTKVSFGELYQQVRPCGDIGKYLYDTVMRVSSLHGKQPLNIPMPGVSEARKRIGFASGECWSLGDSPIVAMMLTYHPSETRPAPRFQPDGTYTEGSGKMITVCTGMDYSFLIRDFFAKLQYHFGTTMP